MGSGLAGGENRAVEAATQAISSPLLENICIDGATGIIINVTGGPDLTLWEVNEASTLITEAAHPDAEIIFGAVIDENMGDNVSVTVIATGFGTGAQKMASEQLHRLNSVAEQQLMNAGMSRLQEQMNTQAYETINLSLDVQPEMAPPPPPAPVVQSQPAHVQHQAVSHQVLHAPLQASPPHPQPQAAPVPAPAPVQKTLPRDALLAKARAYRESQVHRDLSQPEQLSMNMDEAMPQRLQPEPARSPFENDNLEVPSYLRRKRGLGADQNEGMD
jgi:cell division protein FtsZ